MDILGRILDKIPNQEPRKKEIDIESGRKSGSSDEDEEEELEYDDDEMFQKLSEEQKAIIEKDRKYLGIKPTKRIEGGAYMHQKVMKALDNTNTTTKSKQQQQSSLIVHKPITQNLPAYVEHELKRLKEVVHGIAQKAPTDLTLEDFEIQYELISLMSFKYGARSLYELCQNIQPYEIGEKIFSRGKPEILQLIYKMIFPTYLQKEEIGRTVCVVDKSISVKTRTDIIDGEHKILVDYSSQLRELESSFDDMWIVNMTLGSIKTSTTTTLEVSNDIPGSRTVIIEYGIPSSLIDKVEVNEETGNKMISSNNYLVRSTGKIGSIHRDLLWSLIITTKDIDFFDKICVERGEYILMKKNVFTLIFMSVLLKSHRMLPSKIYGSVWKANENSDKDYYKWSKKNWLDVRSFVEPYMKSQTVDDLNIVVKKFSGEKWNTETDGKSFKMNFTLGLYMRVNLPKTQLTQTESYIGHKHERTKDSVPKVSWVDKQE